MKDKESSDNEYEEDEVSSVNQLEEESKESQNLDQKAIESVALWRSTELKLMH
jgi:hypothetical protein